MYKHDIDKEYAKSFNLQLKDDPNYQDLLQRVKTLEKILSTLEINIENDMLGGPPKVFFKSAVKNGQKIGLEPGDVKSFDMEKWVKTGALVETDGSND